MATPKRKVVGAGAALTPGQGLGTGAEPCWLCQLGVVFWGKGCKSSRGPTPLCLDPRIPPSGLGCGTPPSPKRLNHWGSLDCPEGLAKPLPASLSLGAQLLTSPNPTVGHAASLCS